MRQICAPLASVALAALLAGSLAAPGEAQAQARALVATDLNLRAGPSTGYPVVAVLPAGLPVVVYGCVGDLSWCDIDVGWERGWVSARYLLEQDRRRPVYQVAPIITFEFGPYWDRWYSEREFYRDRRGARVPHWREDRGFGEERDRRADPREDWRLEQLRRERLREEDWREEAFRDEAFRDEPPPPPTRRREAERSDRTGDRTGAERPRTRSGGGALSGGDFFE